MPYRGDHMKYDTVDSAVQITYV